MPVIQPRNMEHFGGRGEGGQGRVKERSAGREGGKESRGI
jgi:hypothetical protein